MITVDDDVTAEIQCTDPQAETGVGGHLELCIPARIQQGEIHRGQGEDNKYDTVLAYLGREVKTDTEQDRMLQILKLTIL